MLRERMLYFYPTDFLWSPWLYLTFLCKIFQFFSFQLFIAKVVKEKLLKNEQVMNMYGDMSH